MRTKAQRTDVLSYHCVTISHNATVTDHLQFSGLNDCLSMCFDRRAALILVFADGIENMLLRYFYPHKYKLVCFCTAMHQKTVTPGPLYGDSTE